MLLPNDWGMFDMYGNAIERCQNVYHTPADEEIAPEYPEMPRAVRGGNHMSEAVELRSAWRHGVGGSLAPIGYGLRVARTILD
jgi:formylglycine-generating enzyme required for sulfatase activity